MYTTINHRRDTGNNLISDVLLVLVYGSSYSYRASRARAIYRVAGPSFGDSQVLISLIWSPSMQGLQFTNRKKRGSILRLRDSDLPELDRGLPWNTEEEGRDGHGRRVGLRLAVLAVPARVRVLESCSIASGTLSLYHRRRSAPAAMDYNLHTDVELSLIQTVVCTWTSSSSFKVSSCASFS